MAIVRAQRSGVTTPLAIGATLSCFCATYHAARLMLHRLGFVPVEPQLSMASGAVAGCTMSCVRPGETAVRTDLHVAAVVGAANVLLAPPSPTTNPFSQIEHVDLRRKCLRRSVAPVVSACGSSWILLLARRHHGMAAAEATAPLLLGTLRWAPSIGALTMLPDAGAAAGIHNALLLVGSGAANRLCAAVPVRLLLHGPRATMSRRGLMELLVDAIASAALQASMVGLARAGGRTCAFGGWLPGLVLLAHPDSRRVDLAIRLGYHAVFAALDTVLQAVSVAVGDAIAIVVARAAETAVLSVSTALLLREHAKAAAGDASALSQRSYQALHVLLGYDDDDDLGAGTPWEDGLNPRSDVLK